MLKLGWHFDFHSHEGIRINANPDVEVAARTLRECGVEEIITFAKGHDGYAYYPTKAGTPHPRMTGDAFGDFAKACHAEGIRVLAYLSFGIDGAGGRLRPEWLQMKNPEEPALTSEDWYACVCPFTSYMDALMYPQIEEIIEAYPIDGFWFDTMSAFNPCHCPQCREGFRAAHGLEIPAEEDDANAGVYGQFRHARGIKMLEDVGRFIKARKPDAKVGFNQQGTVRHPEPMPEGITCLTLDFATCGPQSMQASMCSAFGATAELPADVMNTIFNQGWGDWSPRPEPVLEQEAVAVWARKCRPYLGDRLHPENRLDPITVRALQFMKGLADQVADAHPAPDAALTPDMLLLHGPQAMYGEDMRKFALDRTGIVPLEGAHHLLLDAGANFAITAEVFMAKQLEDCKLLIVPEMPAITAETDRALKQFVEGGGQVLVTGCVPNVDGKPMDWLGVAAEKGPWQDHIYMPLWDAADDESPVLVRGDFYRHTADEAETVLPAIRPYDCVHGLRFGWGIGPAGDTYPDVPMLTKRTVGQGRVWFLASRLFSCYRDQANWTQIAWLRECLARLVPAPVARVVSEAGTVEVVAHANAATTWLFLVNHGGEQLNGERTWSRTLAPVPPYPVLLEVRDAAGRKPSAVTSRAGDLAWTTGDDAVTMPLTMDRIWDVVRVDWEA